MRLFLLIFLTTVMGFGLIATSCISDSISTSASDILEFSTDTVSFDTIFTDVGTPTARLIVRNRASKGVVISSIRMKSPGSPFSLNVDGENASEFNDIEIRANDSIYIFIECFIPETEDFEPRLTADELEFVTNGVLQQVRLEAYGMNVTRLKNAVIDTDTRFTATRPYVVFGDLLVREDATLTIEPGTKMLFHDGASMTVRGRLVAQGEPGKFISFRGDRLDNILPGVPYDLLAGQWIGITFTKESIENILSYVDLRSTKTGVQVESDGTDDAGKLLIHNSWLHNSEANVLKARGGAVNAFGVCFSDASGAVVSLDGGDHEFVQCTIANNYLFSAISSPLIELLNVKGSVTGTMKAQFENCIIYGLADDLNLKNLDETEVFFRNVSFKSAGRNDSHFIDCLWECDPLFLTDRAEYRFNYHVAAGSPVIGKGNPAFVNADCRYDMDGVDRLADGNPTLGSYAKAQAPCASFTRWRS